MTERLRKILRSFSISEISAVRKPAQEHAKALIMKSADTAPETGDIAVEAIHKMLSDGDFDGFQKHDYMDLLNSLAEEIQQEGESIQKAFTRGLETPAGVELFGLMKAARGPEVKAPAVETTEYEPRDEHIGVEHARLAALADHEVARKPGLSRRQAVANILQNNEALSTKIKREKLKYEMGRSGSDDAGTASRGPGSLTLDQAIALEPARAFPAYGHPGQKQPAATGRTTGSVVSGQRSQGERSY
jgi:hypothetical protein